MFFESAHILGSQVYYDVVFSLSFYIPGITHPLELDQNGRMGCRIREDFPRTVMSISTCIPASDTDTDGLFGMSRMHKLKLCLISYSNNMHSDCEGTVRPLETNISKSTISSPMVLGILY